MTSESQPTRADIEAAHPVVRGAGRKGATCGVVGFGVFLVVGVIAWALSPLANLGLAYTVFEFLPYGLGAGLLFLSVSLILRRRSRAPQKSKGATSD